MCQTEYISQSIIRLSKRSFAKRIELVEHKTREQKAVLTRLNNQLDSLYESLYDNYQTMTVSDYKTIEPYLSILIETLKDLHTAYLKQESCESLHENINRLQMNISAIEEIKQDFCNFKIKIFNNPRYSSIIEQAKRL